MSSALERALTLAIEALDREGFRYAIVGGLAVGAWGVSRSTRDVDLYVELPEARRKVLAQSLIAQGFEVPAMDEELRSFGVFRSRSSDGVFVDVFDAVGPLGQQLLEHRREISVFGRHLWVTAPEELFLLKAFSDRERDFEDLVSLASLPRLPIDLGYVREWARRLDGSIGTSEVSDRVEQSLRRAKRSATPGPR
jgi:predicted nucleotidyltransferase